jgi:predicted SAM-dependent methyltransferase
MTWSLENSKNDESSKVRWELVPYMNGRCLDLGCGPYKVFPHFLGVDNGHHWGFQGADIRVETAEKLDLFAGASCDLVYSSHLLEHFHYEKLPSILSEWMRVIKPGGHLVLYVPDKDEYPNVGHPHANADHKFDPTYENIVEAMEQVPYAWDLVDFQKRNQGDEYSLFFCFKRL